MQKLVRRADKAATQEHEGEMRITTRLAVAIGGIIFIAGLLTILFVPASQG